MISGNCVKNFLSHDEEMKPSKNERKGSLGQLPRVNALIEEIN
jgi:hypothetical protein